MGDPDDRKRRTPLYERQLSQRDADRYVRLGAPLMGFGMAMIVAAGLLLARMIDTSNKDKSLVITVAILVLVGYSATFYGGIRWGHGRKKGGVGWLKPRAARRLLAFTEYFWLVSACILAIGEVLLVVLALLTADQAVWLLFAFNMLVCLSAIVCWRVTRNRRRRIAST